VTFALFLDMLGTSHTLAGYPDDHKFSNDQGNFSDPFMDAHRRFRQATALAADCARGEAFVALFSDCMYFVSNDIHDFCHDVSALLYFMRYEYIPFRGGIGKGNFHFEQTSHTSKSNLNFNESSFFGTSIVRAHRAESCGLKGIRVFVHQSAAPDLVQAFDGLEAFPEQRLQTEEDPRPPSFGILTLEIPGSPVSDVAHEVNYVGDRSLDQEFRGLDMIESRFRPDKGSLVHYVETREFLERVKRKRSELQLDWDEAASKYGIWR
jgi:hypothetical protein